MNHTPNSSHGCFHVRETNAKRSGTCVGRHDTVLLQQAVCSCQIIAEWCV